MEPLIEDDEVDASGHLAASQDFPQYSQSRGLTTLRVCAVCKFTTRSEGEYANHVETHPKCMDCGFFFIDDASLNLHKSSFHVYVICDICNKDVLEGTLVSHKKGHQTTTGYKKVVSKGKVKVPKEKHVSEATEKMITGYRHFLKTMRPQVRSENPGASPQEMVRLLNAAWNVEKENGKKSYWDVEARKAKDAEMAVSSNYVIKKCNICNLMIANLDEHMALHHNVQSSMLGASSDYVGERGEVVSDVIDLSKDVQAPPETENLIENVLVDDGLPDVVSTEDSSIPDVDQVSVVPEPEDSLTVGKIVLVQKKSLHWPARILGLNGNKCLVKYFDAARSEEEKHFKFIIPFTSNQAICEGRSSTWVKAWKAALKEYES